MSIWSRGLEQIRGFVHRLPRSAFVAFIEVAVVSLSLGVYLSFQETTEHLRSFLLVNALLTLAVLTLLLLLRGHRPTKTEQSQTHTGLSIALIAVAIIFNLLAMWIVVGLETKG